ncbi:hypothetical protein JCM3770_004379 [Rhodotorula araucariae]
MRFTQSSIFFLLLNFLRLLSVVAICLVFAGEIYTINADITGLHASQAAAATPSTTATTRITRRAADILVDKSSAPSPPEGAAVPVPTSQRFEKVHRSLMRRLDVERVTHELQRRAPIKDSASLIDDDDGVSSSGAMRATSTLEARANKTSAGIRPTATNVPAAANAEEGGCTYVGSTSIPRGPGGALFSTLERIFSATILLLALLSELPPPFPPLSRPEVLLERFWSAFFPPFGGEYGVGVLGATQVFVGAQVLSHYTTGWVQVSAWLLFLVGIFNLLAGLAFGARLKVLRSLSQDSTTPSALRRLRLQRAAEAEAEAEQPGAGAGVTRARAWEQFDCEPAAPTPARPQRRSLVLAAFRRPERADAAPQMMVQAEHRPLEKRSRARNGPQGIVIGAPTPLPLRGGAGGKAEGAGVSVPPPTYQDGRE